MADKPDQRSATVGGAKKTRRGTDRVRQEHEKVKTGCITCKLRRIKCDEKKPECERCSKTGRQCEYSLGLHQMIAQTTPDGLVQSQGLPLGPYLNVSYELDVNGGAWMPIRPATSKNSWGPRQNQRFTRDDHEFTRADHDRLLHADDEFNRYARNLLEWLLHNPKKVDAFVSTLPTERRWTKEQLVKRAIGMYVHTQVVKDPRFIAKAVAGGKAFGKDCKKKFGRPVYYKEMCVQYSITLGRHVDDLRRQEAAQGSEPKDVCKWYYEQNPPDKSLGAVLQNRHSHKHFNDAHINYATDRFNTHVDPDYYSPRAIYVHHKMSKINLSERALG